MPKSKKKKKISGDQIEKMKEDIEAYRTEMTCKVCLENLTDRVFLPCSHLICCESCSNKLRYCPMCRAKIMGLVTIHRV